jgi:flagellar basal-body rod modification protein FlgD
MGTVGTQYSNYNNLGAGGSNGTSGSNSQSSASNSTNGMATESAFLQLLVAQLKNQNPMQPMDGTTFVTQLAQFNDVEQNLAQRTDLDAISEKLLGTTTPPSQITSDKSNSTTGTGGN